jgi:hypothetical protein
MTDQIIEWAPFTLREGVSEAALTDASRLIQGEFLSRQEGFLYRQLVRESEGKYADIIWWSSLAAAEAAMAKAATSPACGGYFDLMYVDPANPNDGIKHLHVVAQYAAG